MKKTLIALLAVLWLTALAGCGAASPPPPAEAGVDVDLTALSGNMVYSQVYSMASDPEQYLGKTVKMRGGFAVLEGEEKTYFSCIISDATACCAQGIEFELSGQAVYPRDYPTQGEEITVVGVFDSYEEEMNGNTYRYMVLRDAALQ